MAVKFAEQIGAGQSAYVIETVNDWLSAVQAQDPKYAGPSSHPTNVLIDVL